jgi:aspartate/methionine/tyrosine aminotransferase
MEIMERAQELERAGRDIVHLEVGEPDFAPPECVQAAAAAALRDGHTHYTHSLGRWDLREAIAAHYARRYRVEVAPDRILATTGTSGGLALLMAHLLGPGDEVALPNPGYACYPNFVRAFHGEVREHAVRAETGYAYEPEAVRAALSPRTRAVLVNSPANPTAALQPRAVLEALAELPAPLISDEIYHGLEYGDSRAVCALEVTPDAYILDGCSKRYAMTGYRIGWLIAPPGAVPALQRLQQNLFICPPSIAQHAALAALNEADADVERMRWEYARRRDLLVGGLRRLGFGVPGEPAGAYYVLADARHLAGDSLLLAHRLLEEAAVGVTPGVDFGSRAEGHLRFSFASAAERIAEGLRRLELWLERREAAPAADRAPG